MMKFHQITGGRPKVVSAVTMPERLVRATRSTAMADRVYDGYQWYEAPNGYMLEPTNPVLIQFSDDTYGVCREGDIAAALAIYDVSLADA